MATGGLRAKSEDLLAKIRQFYSMSKPPVAAEFADDTSTSNESAAMELTQTKMMATQTQEQHWPKPCNNASTSATLSGANPGRRSARGGQAGPRLRQ